MTIIRHLAIVFWHRPNHNKGIVRGNEGVHMDMPSIDTTRRIRRVSVEPVVLAAMLTKPKEGVNIELDNPIPQTAGIVGGAFDHTRNCFVLFIADESFEVTPEGTVPPEHVITARAVYG